MFGLRSDSLVRKGINCNAGQRKGHLQLVDSGNLCTVASTRNDAT